VCWAALAWFLLEAVVAVALADWYVNLLVDNYHRM
jgi:hypothetical protein